MLEFYTYLINKKIDNLFRLPSLIWTNKYYNENALCKYLIWAVSVESIINLILKEARLRFLRILNQDRQNEVRRSCTVPVSRRLPFLLIRIYDILMTVTWIKVILYVRAINRTPLFGLCRVWFWCVMTVYIILTGRCVRVSGPHAI